MPLPQNGSLSLHGPSRPGEGNAKPKQAMILRLSEDTLDALQNLAAGEGVEFEAGDKPGIIIRNAFFPMSLQAESTPRELFIRTTSAVRPNGPLKLNANVAGRYIVQRDLSEKLTRQIHESSVAAAKQKNERHTIVLDSPPIAPMSKGKKARPKTTPRSSLLPPNRISMPQRPTSPMPPQSQPTASSSSSPAHSDGNSIISREKLIHFLALRSQSLQSIFQFAGATSLGEPARRQLMERLKEVAEEEPPPKKAANTAVASRIWRLKPTTWLDVRPREYPDYNDNERLAVARSARNWLVSLKVPENTPAWEHVAYRSNNPSAKSTVPPTNKSTTSASTKKVETKSSLPPKDAVKRENTKPKVEPASSNEPKQRSSLPAKVETNRPQELLRNAVAKNMQASDNEREDGEISATPPPPRTLSARTFPGSKAMQSQRPSPSATPQSSTNAAPTVSRRTGPVDARAVKRELPAPSGSANPAPPIAPPTRTQKKPVTQVKSIKSEIQRDTQTVPSTSTVSPTVKSPDKPIKEEFKSKSSTTITVGVKRKQRELEDEDSDWANVTGPSYTTEIKKKRVSEVSNKSTGQSATKVSRPHPKEEESKPLKTSKPVVIKKEVQSVSQTKIKKESSPMSTSRPVNSTTLPSTLDGLVKTERATSRSTTSSAKPRRRSPIYTSSEEEDENMKLSPKLNGHTRASTKSLPQDHASLRERYATAYVEYISTFQQVVAQKNKIEKLLKGSGGSSGGVTDSEGDVDMMSAEELDKLSKKHRSLQEELESIKTAWDR